MAEGRSTECTDLHECYMNVIDVVLGRLNVLLSFIGVALNLLIIVRMKNPKTPNTPLLIVQLQMAIMDCIYCLAPSAFLSYFHYDKDVVHVMAAYELQTCLYISGYFWTLKQFVTYFLILLMGTEKILLTYLGDRIRITKRSAYIATFILGCLAFAIVTLPIAAGLSYKMSRFQGLVEFTGQWSQTWVVTSSHFEYLYTVFPVLVYILVWVAALRILVGRGSAAFSRSRFVRARAAPQRHHNPRVLLYLGNFLVGFTPWIIISASGMVELFDWRHGDGQQFFAKSYLTFTAGLLLLTVQSIISALIYFR